MLVRLHSRMDETTRARAMGIYDAHRNDEKSGILDLVLPWWDEGHAEFVGGFMLMVSLARREELSMSLEQYLAWMVSKAAGYLRDGYPLEAMKEAAQRIQADTELEPALLFDFVSLFTRDELQKIGW